MRYFSQLSLLLIALLLGLPTEATAQVSNCERSLGEAFLDVNNVRARILNNGGLFYRGEPHVYEVPKGTGSKAIFASGIWLAGTVDGQLRAAATRYGEWEFWAGPLDENGRPPTDCAIYDHVFKVSRADIEEFEATGASPPDLRNWPTGLGAPTLAPLDNGIDDDGDGDIDERDEQVAFDINVPLAQRVNRVVDLVGGERPAILGDMTLWAVFNDLGNTHESTDSPEIGVEVHQSAFAFNTAGDIGNTTFYKYNFFYKGSVPLENTYLGIFSDPDLGNFDDDYVGSDTLLGMGYVYNADNFDEGGEGYGPLPPAAGYDFFQGPIVPAAATDTAFVSGVPVPGFKNLGMTHFVFYNNGGCVICDPVTGADYYIYMSGRWKDGQQITFGGNGRDFSNIPVNFIFPGDPVTGEGWSEFNPAADGSEPPIDPADRRFVLSTGPFTINPGDQQEIIFGLVWAQGIDHLDSVTKLREADALAQAAFDVNFELPQPPNAPTVTVTELDGQIILEWENSPRSNNYLESYSEADPFAPDDNKNYEFEGYRVIEYADVADQIGKIVAYYDVPNGVTRIIDGPPGGTTSVVAAGTDKGVQRFHVVGSLTNYTTYHFGVQAYAYNEPSFPKIFLSTVTRVQVTPTRGVDILSEAAVEATSSNLSDDSGCPGCDIFATKVGIGEGRVWADIVNPARITGSTYTVEFYEITVADKQAARIEVDLDEPDERFTMATADKTAAGTAITYDVKRDGTVVFDGSATGEAAPQRENLLLIDGLQISIVGPAPGFKGFAAVANAAGPIDPPDMAAFAFNNSGFPQLEVTGITPPGTYPNSDRPTRGVQQANSSSAWGIHTGGNRTSFAQWLSRTIFARGRTIDEAVGSNNHEMRFSQRCVDDPSSCIGWRRFEDDLPMEIPFEIWNTGTTDDPADDYRMLPAILDNGGEAWSESVFPDTMYTLLEKYDVGGDHPISGGANDPYTDWVYWFDPADTSPGEAGYQAFAAAPGNGSPALGGEKLARTVLVSWNGWTDSDPDGGHPFDGIRAPLPETGTIFRIITLKPSQPGDTFTLDTGGLGTEAPALATQQARLDEIGIVPNPYKGVSNYERSQLTDEVRFTNMPEQATIRIFTLNGSLIKTFRKNSPDRFLKWNLTTDNNLPISSGVYLVHIDVPGVGERVIKFAVVKKRVQLNVF